jgi:hypothetical protein
LTEKSLLDALRAGRTVASKYVSSVDLTPVPAFQPQEVDRPEFRLKVTYVRPSTAPKTVELYRDGKKVEEATQEFPAGRTELVYQWHDTTAAKGEHTYILRIPVVLTMSPIVLNVIGEVEPAVSDPARIADFDTFLRRFQQALAEKDKDTIRRMMSADFFDVHGAETPEGFLELLGDLYSWEDMSQVAAGKREVGGDEQGEHIITRKGGAMLFRKVNGFWRFAMWMSGD